MAVLGWQTYGSSLMLGVERRLARCRSLVSRFIASVSESWAAEMRASRWKNAVAFLDSRKAAAETRMPAERATSTSMTVKPRRAPAWRRWGSKGVARALMVGSVLGVVLEHGRDEVDLAV